MTQLTLKYGDITVEYDGSEEFLKEELPQILRTVAELRTPAIAQASPAGTTGEKGASGGAGLVGMSVTTLSQKLGVKSGPDLVVASALSFVGSGQSVFTKKQLRDRMKEATGYYKATFAGNFDKIVDRLSKAGRLHHVSGTNYSLPEEEKASLLARVGGAPPHSLP